MVIGIILLTVTMYYLYQKKMRIWLWMLSLWAMHGLFEDRMHMAYFNSLLLIVSSRFRVESDDSGVEPTVSRCSFLKGALDGKIVTEEDWKVLSNNIVYQIQTDIAVLALGTVPGLLGKRTFPQALTGTLQGAEIYVEGKAIDVSDYSTVTATINEGATSEGKDFRDITDIYSYLKALNSTDYTIFIAVCDEGTSSLNDKIVALLKKQRTKTDLFERAEDNVFEIIHYRDGYYAVLFHGESLDENVSHDKYATIGNLSDGTEYEIESVGYDTGESVASIKIAGEEYAMNLR